MTARLLPGAPAAEALLADASARAARLPAPPHLVMVRLGDDPASVSYVRGKDRKAREVGLTSTVYALPETTPQAELLDLIARLNADDSVNGILVQLPLPAHVSEQAVLHAIDPRKDVDGFHPLNVGELWAGRPALRPCTPAGILYLLDHYGIPVAGQRAVVVGRSHIVGRPLAGLLLNRDATVTVTHSRTIDLGAVTREADLLCVAVGQPHLITPEMVRPGATVIDVGINRVPGENGGKAHLTGDVDPEVARVAGAITPVPGGVGPMTIAQLLANTVAAAEMQAR
ncbi:bifunctional 5,10-methylene-tetrahydrofolate dehydrogenase/5,10-methylene-tetrahydrofolate cyclohydrolase [Deinococcus metallilatus]|uniref:Bifunctional protein FolD n=1 Tax=Deinococcus metallilatus TaxID=1211322 RepID=A0AAJ5K0A4_9DEIO|nr:tetrahydrofolate dehydrogenase/cyclohydrolase catalytic domain-containing protein [Deinococcus metallilatus]MBB5294031.1 methylenetetrahydrofolate dehydrogenase (NADP+)/methenyltetrahydrofolate cyclohydrolase [Deinococcus metallilatus]QBY08822.1 bifunctional 5,10-methylene-tetrahydrofolate dehydrogenase/5,10-methylene-tetrahydrofolate cyclohydrolase [Deinococcus metallilatus]RXJ09966.1 bifunctional 5,10-methylene-tetrahydrofolate dehydrogenase/5,10-methylene-tetrahydrofolate cyclohydrolase [D